MNKYFHQLTVRLGIVIFTTVALLFIGFYFYWRMSVIPQIYNTEQAKADLAAMAYSRIIGQALESGDREQVIEALDQLTILRDPLSQQPVLEAIRITTEDGGDIERRIIVTEGDMFFSELPIFSAETQAFIGSLRIDYNRAFYNKLLADAQVNFAVSLAVGIILLVFTFILLSYLLKPLRTLVSNIKEIKTLDSSNFPTLKGKASEDILQVESAILHLIERLNQSNRALRDSEAQVRLLLNSTAEAIFGVDLDGNCTFANPACLRMLGYDTDEELLGKHMHGLVHHSHADGSPYPENECQIYAPLRNQSGIHVEDECLWRKDGQSIPVEYSSFPIFREQELVGAVITFVDITERKKAQETQQRLMGILEATPDIVGMADKDGNVLYLNQAGRMKLGFGADEDIHTRHISDFHSADVAQYIFQHMLPLAASAGSWRGETKILTRNNEEIPVSQVIIAHKSLAGEVKYYSTIITDITQQKQAEEQLHQYRDHLEELVAERTRELEASNKELESYSYSIAHDLRAPLRTIVSFGQIIDEEINHKLSPDESTYLHRLISAGKYMAKLIDDILDLARISRAELKPVTVNITNLATSISTRLQQTDKHRETEWIIQEGVQTIGDQALLTIALENLLGNAWKYTSKSNNAHIEVGQIRQNGQTVFYVKDNGVGFDMTYADKLFVAFQRLHGDEFEGTGIGLATVARIIYRHGGRIWTQAAVDRGATFYFTLASYKQEYTQNKQTEIEA